jgi:hypothetical protein
MVSAILLGLFFTACGCKEKPEEKLGDDGSAVVVGQPENLPEDGQEGDILDITRDFPEPMVTSSGPGEKAHDYKIGLDVDERIVLTHKGYVTVWIKPKDRVPGQRAGKVRDTVTVSSNEMKEYALNEGSIYGEYASLHTRAMVLLQIQDNKKAERAFVEALYFRRRHFPNESAAEDLRELMKISYYRGDILMAKKYGQQLLAEPNVTPHHKGRVLSRLSTIAFDEDSVEEFNHIYNEMIRLEKTDGIRMVTLFTKVNYYIINSIYTS